MADFNIPETTERCICGRAPALTKSRGGYLLACPAWQTCDWAPNGGRYPTLPQAVEGWNFFIDRLRAKEAPK